MPETSTQLPKWKSHKEVYADKITKVGQAALTTESGGWIELIDTDIGNRIKASEKKPQVGDYYVQYEDGYESWSPAKAFEDGYTKV